MRVCRGRLEGDKVYGRCVNQMTFRKRGLKCEGWSNIFFNTTNTLFLRSEAQPSFPTTLPPCTPSPSPRRQRAPAHTKVCEHTTASPIFLFSFFFGQPSPSFLIVPPRACIYLKFPSEDVWTIPTPLKGGLLRVVSWCYWGFGRVWCGVVWGGVGTGVMYLSGVVYVSDHGICRYRYVKRAVRNRRGKKIPLPQSKAQPSKTPLPILPSPKVLNQSPPPPTPILR